MMLKTLAVALAMSPFALGAPMTESVPEPSSSSSVSTSEPSPSPETETETETPVFDWAEWARGWLSPEVLTAVTGVITVLTLAVRAIATMKQLSKDKNLTAKNVADIVLKEIDDTLPNSVKEEIGKYLPEIEGHLEKQSAILATFSKILALLQEGTPEAKLAILNLIEELGVIEKEATEASKTAVKEAKEAEIAKAVARKEAVAEIVKETEAEADDGTVI